MKLCKLFISIASLVHTVSCEKAGSLTFVIDDTGSMQNDIDIVAEGVDEIMDAVLNKKSSQIKNIVLVRFNDPDAEIKIITKNRYDLKKVLNAIQADGGGDCPENALHGVKLALESSEVNSHLFVFTDASPKDLYLTDEVIRLAQKKSSQVVFIVTSINGCGGERFFYPYYKIAHATFGQVFRIYQKEDVKKIIGFITETSSGEKTVITQTHIPPNRRETVTFNTDDQTEHAIISTSGKDVELGLREMDHHKVHYERVTWLRNVKMVKLINPRPGRYSVIVRSKSETSVMVFGRTDLKFDYGFSMTPVTSLKDTKKSPTEGEEHQLAISVTDPGQAVWVNSAQILDMNENVIKALPLSRKSEDFYTTKSFLPPSSTFLIALIGKGKYSHTPIRRISKTPIQTQMRHFEPTLSINKIENTYEYNSDVHLSCKVKAYPKPQIEWIDERGNILKNAKVEKISPYDYSSCITIDRIKKTQTFTCYAANQHGHGRKNVKVIVQSPFIVKKVLDDITNATYEKDIELICDIKSKWPMKTTWYKNHKPISKHVSKDGTKLMIKKVQLEDQGTYLCKSELKEDNSSKQVYQTDLKITGLKPTLSINKIENTYEYNSDVHLSCKVKAYPKPQIEWIDERGNILKNANVEKISPYDYSSCITIDRIKKTQTFTCYAANQHGHGRKNVKVNVQSPFIVKKVLDDITNATYEKDIELICDIKSKWPMKTTWYKNHKPINKHVSKDGTKLMIKKVHLEDQGTYLCKSELKEDNSSKQVYQTDLKITGLKPTLSINKIENTYEYNSDVHLSCKVKAYPKPQIEWIDERGNILKNAKVEKISPYDYSSCITIDRIKKTQTFTCYAANQHGHGRKNVKVNVQSPFIVKKVLDDITNATYEKDIELICDIKSKWPMKTTWYKNHKPINKHVSKDGTKLMIKKVHLEDQGTYLCKSELKEDNSSKQVYQTDLKITGLMAPRLEIQDTELKITEVKTVTLSCKITEGFPAPELIWKFKEIHSDKWITLPDSQEQLIIEGSRLSSGHYKCVARNVIGRDEMDVHVIVETPPHIKLRDTKVYAVELDLVLRIPCDTVGYPKPTVAWTVNGTAIKLGKRHSLDKETLVIHNPVQNDTSNYTCEVRNKFGLDTKTIEAIVTYDFPLDDKPIVQDTRTTTPAPSFTKHTEMDKTTKYILEGNIIDLSCRHEKEDAVRWYKDREYINVTGSRLLIKNATGKNDGIYRCRVSNYYGTKFYGFLVDVGYGPRGKTDSVTINKEGKDEKLSSHLDCQFDMKPRTNDIEWTFNGEPINENTTDFSADISWGNYTCKVTNPHGTAQKTFYVISYDCLIKKSDKITNSITERSTSPLILTERSTWPADKFYQYPNYLRALRDENMKLFCRNQDGTTNRFKGFSIDDEITATCIEENKFLVNGTIMRFEDLQCRAPVQPVINKTSGPCFHKDTELNKVGFQVDRFVEVFEVCVDKIHKVPLYTRIDMTPVYNLKKTFGDVASGDECREGAECCFGKTQLVNEQDVRYGPSQAATLLAFNYVTYWRPCGGKVGWSSIEDKLRKQLQEHDTQLIVWSGAGHYTSKNDLLIPRYLWKVVKVDEDYAFGIVYVNDPTPVAADKLCKDTSCKSWVDSSESIYCCELADFRKAFDIPEELFV